jgi:CheY-like chemotaxis protein
MMHEAVEILLVEDNPGDVVLTRAALQECRVANSLTVVNDGEQALAYLFGRPPYEDRVVPDLVLLDINIPRINGLEVLEQVKSDERLRRIPVIMLTSSNRERDIATAYDSHANSYINKPPSLPELVVALQSLEDFWFVLVRRPKVVG